MRHVARYYVWFKRSNPIFSNKKLTCFEKTAFLQTVLKSDLLDCPWIDGSGAKIQVRHAALPDVLAYLNGYEDRHIVSDFGSETSYRETIKLFESLMDHGGTRAEEQRRITRREQFACEEEYEDIPVFWFQTVRASQTDSFLYHLLLSMGSFDTELELCAQGSMQRAFVHARLMRDTSDHEVIKQEVQILVQRYIEEQLRHYPIGTRALGGRSPHLKSFAEKLC